MEIKDPEEALRRLASIVESSDDAIVSKDLNGIVTSWNQAAERMFGYTAAEMIGRSIRTIVPADRQTEEDSVLASIARGEKVDHFETWRRRKDGVLIPISLTVSPIFASSGRIIGASKIARDITVRLEAEQLKEQFLATLSHEIRTPLNAILGYASMLRSGLLTPERAERALDAVERNGQALRQIVEDLLDVSRIQSGQFRLHISPVDLPEILNNAIGTVIPAAAAKGVRIEPSIPSDLRPFPGDAARLQQVFWNLLSNAVKFTDRLGIVKITAHRSDHMVEVDVSDTGRGIPAHFLPHVFDRFRQWDAEPTREQRGLGLGLAIARQLVEMHGGTITAFSEGVGKGARFTVRLPVVADTAAR